MSGGTKAMPLITTSGGDCSEVESSCTGEFDDDEFASPESLQAEAPIMMHMIATSQARRDPETFIEQLFGSDRVLDCL